MPKEKGVREGIVKGIYRFRATGLKGKKARVHLFGSGSILNEVIAAQELLEEKFDVATDVWSVTSYKELYQDAIEAERWNLLHPTKKPRKPYLAQVLENEAGIFVAASDYMKVLPAALAKWLPGPLHCLGTDGFGRSDSRERLRDFFEVDRRYVALAALYRLAEAEGGSMKTVEQALKEFKIDPDKLNPHQD